MFAAVRFSNGYGPLRYGNESRMLTNRPPVRMAPHACESTCARSASGEIRSFSTKRRKNRRVRSRSGTNGHHIGDVPRRPLRILAEDEVREDLFERTARQERAKLRDRVVSDDAAFVQDDHARAEFFDDVEDV